MTRPLRASMIALSLLTSAATVHAECVGAVGTDNYLEGVTQECGGNSVGSRYSSVSATKL
jgi:hypothetical protein